MWEYNYTHVQRELYHHGILGQKWGKRNGPPYPLGNSEHSASEKKAGWKNSLDKPIKKSYNKNDIGGISDVVSEETINTAIVSLSTVAVTAGYIAAKRILKRSGERKYNKNVTSDADLPKKKSTMSEDEDMKAANPNFKDYETSNGYIQNCMYCSTVYDLRRRGFDVTANSRKMGGRPKEITQWYKGATLESYKKPDEALKAIQSQPDGARGNLCGAGPFGGHSVAYEVNKGKLTIRDAQSNKKWSWDEFSKRFSSKYYVVRTDNCEPNWDKIGETIDPSSLKKEVK